ncbi:uncharacterized protein LOC6528577 [Drosophila yakuba]|uniref:Uncharacterized protein n=1 Tax=Drosophila yakuba TaxID=7245 RepID=B4P2S1_DROYA|nr:uncharacterized protein LOC6528577 [Drosophila yakuba]EDW89332.1 uncharacterized protein Dyak_GE23091 [Drosophila yakuba]
MMLAKRTLSRAPAAIRSGLTSRTNQVRGMESMFDPYENGVPRMPEKRKDLKKKEPLDNTKVPLKDMCWMSMRRSEYKCRSDPEFNVPSFIDTRKRCLADPCATSYPPSDLIFYKPTDKLNRKYQRTWCECELKVPKRKAVCRCRPPNFFRRPLRTPPLQASQVCPDGNESLGLGLCRPKPAKSSCPRFKMPFCKPASKKGCRPGRPQSNVIRLRTKYPSFSECQTYPLPDVPPTQCFCINQPPMCVVWNYYRMKKS